MRRGSATALDTRTVWVTGLTEVAGRGVAPAPSSCTILQCGRDVITTSPSYEMYSITLAQNCKGRLQLHFTKIYLHVTAYIGNSLLE